MVMATTPSLIEAAPVPNLIATEAILRARRLWPEVMTRAASDSRLTLCEGEVAKITLEWLSGAARAVMSGWLSQRCADASDELESLLPPLRTAEVDLVGTRGVSLGLVQDYLPTNYTAEQVGDTVKISGYDNAGWTLDGYVIPRLRSTLVSAKETTAQEVKR